MSVLTRKNSSAVPVVLSAAGTARDTAVPAMRSARAAARHGAENAAAWSRPRVRAARIWAAPQLEHASTTVRDDVAPRVSAMLMSAAHKVDVDRPARRWPRLLIGVALLAAAGGVAAALFLRRRPDPLHLAAMGEDNDEGDDTGAHADPESASSRLSAPAREQSDGDRGMADSAANGRLHKA